MKTRDGVVLLLCVAVGSFVAGSWYSRLAKSGGATREGRRILYYHDPMHPAYKSDKPGIAPDCGMQLEPVYAGQDDGGTGSLRDSTLFPPATVRIDSGQQQMIGVRVEEVRKSASTRSVRILGRVVADETKVYKVNAAIDGWIRDAMPVTTGATVKKNDVLATYYSGELFAALQVYLFTMNAPDRFQAAGRQVPDQSSINQSNLQRARVSLLNLGMSELQLAEIAASRQQTETVKILSPADGFVLARNVSVGQRFEKGAELFRIADLRKVWVLADLFENDARLVQSAGSATVYYQGGNFHAHRSAVPPVFDPATRTLKVRLEVDNPRFTLRPDMFVDAEFTAGVPAAATVPAEAVLDSGLRKIVFVDRGNGYFEPRQVEIGTRLGNRVVISGGLQEGERIVVAGNFMIDSESRLKLAAAGLTVAATKDPVCGMAVEPAKAATKKAEYQGREYHFCSDRCRHEFEGNPGKYVPKKDDKGGAKEERTAHKTHSMRGPA